MRFSILNKKHSEALLEPGKEITPDTLTPREGAIICDSCSAQLVYIPYNPTEAQLLERRVLPLNYRNEIGEVEELHFCAPCREHQPELIKKFFEKFFDDASRRAQVKVLDNISRVNFAASLAGTERDQARAKVKELEELLSVRDAQLSESEERRLKLEQDLGKSEALHKMLKGQLEALELKLGKLNADDFAARFREPIFVVLLEEGEDIIRRFLAGPPSSEDDLKAFTERLNKWMNSAKKAREQTTTQRTFKAGETLSRAFAGKNQGNKKPE